MGGDHHDPDRLYHSYFYTGVDILVICLAIVLLDIHWLVMGAQLFIYCSIQIVHAYIAFYPIFHDYVLTAIIVSVSVFIIDYEKIKVSKIRFL
jgi:hypothetical protein